MSDDWALLNKMIDQVIAQKDCCTIAIDGFCASGKTTLGKLLREKYACNLFHMDDFYVPSDLKTPERMAVPGGNVYYERFKTEVVLPLINQAAVVYRAYICASGTFYPDVIYPYHSLTIIEGSYSCHPDIVDNYDLRVFVKHCSGQQLNRILERNGPEVHHRFVAEWIPLEMKYFEAYAIEANSHLVIDTSDMW